MAANKAQGIVAKVIRVNPSCVKRGEIEPKTPEKFLNLHQSFFRLPSRADA